MRFLRPSDACGAVDPSPRSKLRGARPAGRTGPPSPFERPRRFAPDGPGRSLSSDNVPGVPHNDYVTVIMIASTHRLRGRPSLCSGVLFRALRPTPRPDRSRSILLRACSAGPAAGPRRSATREPEGRSYAARASRAPPATEAAGEPSAEAMGREEPKLESPENRRPPCVERRERRSAGAFRQPREDGSGGGAARAPREPGEPGSPRGRRTAPWSLDEVSRDTVSKRC